MGVDDNYEGDEKEEEEEDDEMEIEIKASFGTWKGISESYCLPPISWSHVIVCLKYRQAKLNQHGP